MNLTYNTIEIINEIKYKLQFRDPSDKIALKLNVALDDIINIFVLDQGNTFATLPNNLPDKIKPLLTNPCPKEYLEFQDLIYEWIPQSITLTAFLARCYNNKIDISTSRSFSSDIKQALLSLKEEGKIDITSNGIINKLQEIK